MKRADKILKNGIFIISIGQKLTEILQVKIVVFLSHLLNLFAVVKGSSKYYF